MIEKMPFKLGFGAQPLGEPADRPEDAPATGWRAGLPELSNGQVTLREVRTADAPSLFAMLSTDEVHRYMAPPPSDVAGFERFIAWAHAERRTGRYMCFAVVPKGYDVAIGIFQVRQIDPAFTMAEWGAALGSQFWGTGIFEAGVHLLFEFLFDTLGLHRLEARAAVQNGRANGAARKVGAVPEGVARQGLFYRGQFHDQLMWSTLAEDWRQSKRPAPSCTERSRSRSSWRRALAAAHRAVAHPPPASCPAAGRRPPAAGTLSAWTWRSSTFICPPIRLRRSPPPSAIRRGCSCWTGRLARSWPTRACGPCPSSSSGAISSFSTTRKSIPRGCSGAAIRPAAPSNACSSAVSRPTGGRRSCTRGRSCTPVPG